jgi:hypothetical protein
MVDEILGCSSGCVHVGDACSRAILFGDARLTGTRMLRVSGDRATDLALL